MKCLITTMLMSAISVAFAGEKPEVRLVQYRVGASLDDKIPFQVKPMGHEYGAELAFLIKGEGLVNIKEDSVEISKFTTKDGKDLAKNSRGKPSWEEGMFPKVSEDGDYASFTAKSRGELLGKVEGAEIEGKVVLFVGGETDEGSALISKESDPVEIGPLKVSIGKGGGGFFGGGGDGTAIKVVGDHQSIIEISVKDGDKELDGSGSSWSGDTKTFSFEKAKSEKVKVTISYWKNLSEVEVPFKVTVGSEP